MNTEELQKIIAKGEGLTIEFKRCENGLSNSTFETICAFANRYGGHLFLGVADNGEITGINPNALPDIKKNFVNTLNNLQRFSPTLFLSLEDVEIDGKRILWTYVPADSQVVMFAGRIYDRAEDGDFDISRNSERVAQLHNRKSREYSERKIFPYATSSDLDIERLMPKVRRLAQNRINDHPWLGMSDMEILRSAGLYLDDRETGKSGFNLAAILLFGREEVIRSCTPNYLTDAICRRENLDRYDDRLLVTSNLLDAYEQLMDFISKHTLDKFFLIDGQSVSVRSKIARELVSNTLVHREYTSAFPAKLLIERDRITTENWNLPKHQGHLNPSNFTPYPKNPILANFFINIGRADVIGSGVRNLFKYTKIYSGGTPEFVEDDIFRTIVPLTPSTNAESEDTSKELAKNGNDTINEPLNDTINEPINPNEPINEPLNDRINDTLNPNEPIKSLANELLRILQQYPTASKEVFAQKIGKNRATVTRYLQLLREQGKIKRIGSKKTGHWEVLKP